MSSTVERLQFKEWEILQQVQAKSNMGNSLLQMQCSNIDTKGIHMEEKRMPRIGDLSVAIRKVSTQTKIVSDDTSTNGKFKVPLIIQSEMFRLIQLARL